MLCKLKMWLKDALSSVLETEMKAAYDDIWWVPAMSTMASHVCIRHINHAIILLVWKQWNLVNLHVHSSYDCDSESLKICVIDLRITLSIPDSNVYVSSGQL